MTHVLKVKPGCAGRAVGISKCASEDGYVSADTCSDSENSQKSQFDIEIMDEIFS